MGKQSRFRHHHVFRQAPRRLPGTAEKPEFAARVRPAHHALVALPARHRRLDGDTIADLDAGHGRANLLDDPRPLMPDGEGILYDLRADLTLRVIVHIRAAHADPYHADQHILVVIDGRSRHIPHFHLLHTGQHHSLHKSTLSRQPSVLSPQHSVLSTQHSVLSPDEIPSPPSASSHTARPSPCPTDAAGTVPGSGSPCHIP